ncbi:MAG: prenyltransferase/squalene oxidase repeat-containing protein [Gemmataceae bacterium]|nr:squalene--hopene cyclase [Gemmata sp.]MDW8197512.1 prenyltransferase/squalene oxidase repeat-containing protein [Gemmataceae bacterium]
MDAQRLAAAYQTARATLLAQRVAAGHWVGQLSTSALSTATAIMALHRVDPSAHRDRIAAGLRWLVRHQNADGGWGDTPQSLSNISTSMLCRAALALCGDHDYAQATARLENYLTAHAGATATARAAAIRARYGADRTFSVPILMACALAGLVPWREVPRLPFELACLPQSWYRFARLPVVSYALPALIAIGQCIHHHRPSWNPLRNVVRRLAMAPTLKVLRRIQPSTGGYLEATPLTSFVLMALASIPRPRTASEQQVLDQGIHFLIHSVRADGSWPIDTNLATWVTTGSVNALAAAGDLETLDSQEAIRTWLIQQQYHNRHPYTGADPGGWAWTDLPGGVPDADDTPGALLALHALRVADTTIIHRGLKWLLSLQNRDGGWPTFCRGWGTLPFDRSGTDLTAHALRALHAWRGSCPPCWPIPQAIARGLDYLKRQQRPDGSWLPLWFGNQHAPDDINPVYGTARVLAAYRDLGLAHSPECQRGVAYLRAVQNRDGGWGGAAQCPSSVEETALALEVLIDLGNAAENQPAQPAAPQGPTPAAGHFAAAITSGVEWLVDAVERGRLSEPSPIGFYFAKLWYSEQLYPIIFTVAALGRAWQTLRGSYALRLVDHQTP